MSTNRLLLAVLGASCLVANGCHPGPPLPPPPSGEVRLTAALADSAGATVRVHRRAEERVYGLGEDSLAYDVTLVSSSPERSCFDVTLRMLDAQRAYARLDRWTLALDAAGTVSAPASIEAGEAKRSSAIAAPLGVRRGPDMVGCAEVGPTGNCTRHDVYETRTVGREATELPLVESTGRACFAGKAPLAGDVVLRLNRPAAMDAPDSAIFRFAR